MSLSVKKVYHNLLAINFKNLIICQSYETYVSFYNKNDKTHYILDEYFSRTTSKHLTLFSKEVNSNKEVRVNRELFNKMLEDAKVL
jgi:hypothetical protein